MKQKIRVGIIGARADRGWAGAVHVPAVRAVSELDLVGLNTLSRLRYPRVLHLVRAFDPKKPAVMWPHSSFVFYRKIEKTVHDRVQDDALCAEPRPTGTLGVYPDVEYIFGRRGNQAANGNIHFASIKRRGTRADCCRTDRRRRFS
jgi:hypothetical protein